MIYWSWSRVLFCAEGRSYLVFCETRPWTLVDMSGWIQAIFYTAIAIPNRKIQEFFYCYGTLVTNGTLWLTLWYVDSNSTWILNGGKGGQYSTWNAVWTPLFMWMLFTWAFRTSIGLAYWMESMEIDKITDAPTKLQLAILWSWSISGWGLSAVGVLLYKCIIGLGFSPVLGNSDLVQMPGIFGLFFWSFLINLGWGVFLGFLCFQYQIIVWDKRWQSGLIVMAFDSDISIGIIY